MTFLNQDFHVLWHCTVGKVKKWPHHLTTAGQILRSNYLNWNLWLRHLDCSSKSTTWNSKQSKSCLTLIKFTPKSPNLSYRVLHESLNLNQCYDEMKGYQGKSYYYSLKVLWNYQYKFIQCLGTVMTISNHFVHSKYTVFIFNSCLVIKRG